MSQRTGNMGRNVSERSDPPPVTVIGAGPAGLACAIVLARNGQRVIVHERRSRVGARFHGDFQGLDSWSDGIDVLDELTGAGRPFNVATKPLTHSAQGS